MMKKITKIIFCTFLIAVMCSMFVACGNGSLYEKNGSTVAFGSYPQKLVADEGLAQSLTTAAGALPTENDSANWTSYGYYLNNEVQNYMWFMDIEQDGAKYRGVYLIAYRPYMAQYSEGSMEYSYQDENIFYTDYVYWFKYEPIKWTIVKEDYQNKGDALIICNMSIDSQAFNIFAESKKIDGNRVYGNNYEYSTIRTWLNETFYNTAFSDAEKEIIATTTVDNGDGSTGSLNNQYVCNNTQDKVFLPCYLDVQSYDLMDRENERARKVTDYAKSQGALVYNDSEYREWRGNGSWWLRSPYSQENDRILIVDASGAANTGMNKGCNGTYIGVVPALVIKL